jgi:hypothetical protein
MVDLGLPLVGGATSLAFVLLALVGLFRRSPSPADTHTVDETLCGIGTDPLNHQLGTPFGVQLQLLDTRH